MKGISNLNNHNRWKITGLAYGALVKDRPTEVIREFKSSSDGIISLDELNESRRIASLSYLEYDNKDNFGLDRKRKPKNKNMKEVFDDAARLRDMDNGIGINIHTSPDDETSSEGCQNIPISEYAGFIKEIQDNHNSMGKNVNKKDRDGIFNSILYTLIDGSKIEKED